MSGGIHRICCCRKGLYAKANVLGEDYGLAVIDDFVTSEDWCQTHDAPWNHAGSDETCYYDIVYSGDPPWNDIWAATWANYLTLHQGAWPNNGLVGHRYSETAPQPDAIQGDFAGSGVGFVWDVDAADDFGYDPETHELYDITVRLPYTVSFEGGWAGLGITIHAYDENPENEVYALHPWRGLGEQVWSGTITEAGNITIELTEAQACTATGELYLLIQPTTTDPGRPSAANERIVHAEALVDFNLYSSPQLRYKIRPKA